MTDEQIIKALELCIADENCDGCPYDYPAECYIHLKRDALELIRRQQAEIDRLKSLVNDKQEIIEGLEDTFENECFKYSELKAEAIKEFADKLKIKIDDAIKIELEDAEGTNCRRYGRISDGKVLGFSLAAHLVDNLVKEMEGESNEN